MRKIKKGDEIIVIAGKDKGRRGVVLSVLSDGEKLIIEGINTVKKHIKACLWLFRSSFQTALRLQGAKVTKWGIF